MVQIPAKYLVSGIVRAASNAGQGRSLKRGRRSLFSTVLFVGCISLIPNTGQGGAIVRTLAEKSSEISAINVWVLSPLESLHGDDNVIEMIACSGCGNSFVPHGNIFATIEGPSGNTGNLNHDAQRNGA